MINPQSKGELPYHRHWKPTTMATRKKKTPILDMLAGLLFFIAIILASAAMLWLT